MQLWPYRYWYLQHDRVLSCSSFLWLSLCFWILRALLYTLQSVDFLGYSCRWKLLKLPREVQVLSSALFKKKKKMETFLKRVTILFTESVETVDLTCEAGLSVCVLQWSITVERVSWLKVLRFLGNWRFLWIAIFVTHPFSRGKLLPRGILYSRNSQWNSNFLFRIFDSQRCAKIFRWCFFVFFFSVYMEVATKFAFLAVQ